MEKINIEVFIPGINKSYDIVISGNALTADAAVYINKVITEYQEVSLKGENLVLCSFDTKTVLDLEATLFDNGVKNGSRLLLV
jgi:hypothetical protein